MVVATSQTLTPRVSLSNIVEVNASSRRPCYLTRDATTLFYRATTASTAMYASTDDGSNITQVYTAPTGFNVKGCLETNDGQLLISTQSTDLATGKLYKTTNFPTFPLSATEVHTTVAGEPLPIWALHPWSLGPAGFIVTNEYGGQTTTTGDQTLKGRRAWYSTDHGATWTLFFDLMTFAESKGLVQPAGTGGLHVHATAYDPFDNRVWLTYGDNTGVGPTVAGGGQNAQIAYTDNWTAATPTWTHVTLPTTMGVGSQMAQVVTIAPLENAVCFLPDGNPYSPLMLPRLGYRSYGPMQMGPMQAGSTGNLALGEGFFRRYGRQDLPCFASINTPTGGAARCGLHASVDGGLRWDELWRDTTATARTMSTCYGPTSSGKVHWWSAIVGGAGAWTTGTRYTADITFS